jgi:hypothetical protein
LAEQANALRELPRLFSTPQQVPVNPIPKGKKTVLLPVCLFFIP